MSGEEDEKEYELKDLIVQTLEANGVLPKIKAQIRANVFKALDQKNNSTSLENINANKVLTTNDGRTAAALVRDFLEKSNLEYTLGVFDPELNSASPLDRRERILDVFKLNDRGNVKDLPLLIEIVKRAYSQPASSSSNRDTPSELSQKIIDAVKSKFDYIDVSRKGLIDEEKARDLFADLFPNFSRGVIDAFLGDELNNSDILRGVEYSKFLSIFKKWYFQCQRTHEMTEEVIDSIKIKPKNPLSKLEQSNDSFDNFDFKLLNKKESNGLSDDLKKSNNNGLSSLGDLPPLNGNPSQNKKSINLLNKDLDKRFKDDDDNYDEDFTSGTTPRTPNQERKSNTKNRGGMVSDDEIEDNLSYVEESSKNDEITVDKSISTIQNNDADYLEDVTI